MNRSTATWPSRGGRQRLDAAVPRGADPAAGESCPRRRAGAQSLPRDLHDERQRQASGRDRQTDAGGDPHGPQPAGVSPGQHTGRRLPALVPREIPRPLPLVLPLRQPQPADRLCLGQRRAHASSERRQARSLRGFPAHAGRRQPARRLGSPRQKRSRTVGRHGIVAWRRAEIALAGSTPQPCGGPPPARPACRSVRPDGRTWSRTCRPLASASAGR